MSVLRCCIFHANETFSNAKSGFGAPTFGVRRHVLHFTRKYVSTSLPANPSIRGAFALPPQRGDAYQRRVQPWKGQETGMRSEGTPHKDGSDTPAAFADMRRSFRTHGRVGLCPQGLHPGLVCAAPLGRMSRDG
jgi:hypothetical protein